LGIVVVRSAKETARDPPDLTLTLPRSVPASKAAEDLGGTFPNPREERKGCGGYPGGDLIGGVGFGVIVLETTEALERDPFEVIKTDPACQDLHLRGQSRCMGVLAVAVVVVSVAVVVVGGRWPGGRFFDAVHCVRCADAGCPGGCFWSGGCVGEGKGSGVNGWRRGRTREKRGKEDEERAVIKSIDGRTDLPNR